MDPVLLPLYPSFGFLFSFFALELRQEGSARSALPCRGRKKTGKGKAQAKGRERAKHAAWREAVRFVAVSQDGAGAFLNATPMRDDMRMETWVIYGVWTLS